MKALIVGLAIGMLIAPRSGRESRRILEEWIREFFRLGDRRLDEMEAELETRKVMSEEEIA